MKEFTVAQFAAHLAKLSAVGPEVMHLSAEKCGEIVERSAKAEIGMYQPKAGPYEEWPELEYSTQVAHQRAMQSGHAAPDADVESPLLVTGELRSSITHYTRGEKTVIGSTSPLMVYHEFGTRTVPPRPVIGRAMFINSVRIQVGLGRVLDAWIAGMSWKREPISDK